MVGLGAAAAAGAGAGIIQGGMGVLNGIVQGEYNKEIQNIANEASYELQKRANDFTREQSQNQIKYNIQQMKDLGLSPMMLFDHGNATGGSAGGGSSSRGATGASAPNYFTGIIDGINTAGRMMLESEKQNLEERKIDLYEKRLSNFRNFDERNYTKKDFKNVFDDLDKVEI